MLGVWISKDTLGFAAGQTNWYSYVGGDPINYIDQEGKARDKIDGEVVDVHLNDVDNWPSSPHGHIYDRNHVVDSDGNVYDKNTRKKVGQLTKKGKVRWKAFLKRLGPAGVVLSVADLFLGSQDV